MESADANPPNEKLLMSLSSNSHVYPALRWSTPTISHKELGKQSVCSRVLCSFTVVDNNLGVSHCYNVSLSPLSWQKNKVNKQMERWHSVSSDAE